jgi:protein-tyrosine-phosphatase
MLTTYSTARAKNVLVVCTGNLFRSPMAAAFIHRTLEQDALEDNIFVTSAGLEAVPGIKAPESVISTMLSEYKIDLTGHITRPVTAELFQRADLILVMEQAQAMRLAQQYPRYTRKLKLFSELVGEVYNIEDPAQNPNVQITVLAKQLDILAHQGLVTLLRWLKLGN